MHEDLVLEVIEEEADIEVCPEKELAEVQASTANLAAAAKKGMQELLSKLEEGTATTGNTDLVSSMTTEINSVKSSIVKTRETSLRGKSQICGLIKIDKEGM